jgi:putative tryptophan/tyrosine transport system substrate-binding protein
MMAERAGMNRRILLVASAASALLAAAPGLAQQSGRTYRLGLLSTGPTPTASRPNPNVKAFRSALRELGYIEGRNLVIEERYADGKRDRLAELARELTRANVDVILAATTLAAAEAQRVTRTTPIVMGSAADPVAAGLIASLGRPAGNVTGLTLETPDLIAKRLELLKETLPALRRIGAFYPGEWRSFAVVARWIEASQAAARELGLPLEMMDLSLEPERWDAVFREAAAAGIDAVMVMETGVYFSHGARLAQACVKSRLPGIFPFREQAEAGGLMAYGANVADLWRRAAGYVDRIFKGANPGDLPVEQPTKFDLVINAKTAKALGITLPQSIRLRADKVIE